MRVRLARPGSARHSGAGPGREWGSGAWPGVAERGPARVGRAPLVLPGLQTAGLAREAAQGGDERLAVGRAQAGHVVVALEGDLPGVAEHVEALVIRGGQRREATVVLGAQRTAPRRRATAGERQRVGERAAGQLV